MSRAHGVGLLATALLVSGCSVVPPPPPPGGSDPELDSLRASYGIADCPDSDQEAAQVEDGLPAVLLPCLGSGRPVDMAGLSGRPMVLNFWAQWCEPCRREAPILREAASERTDVDFVGVNYDDPDQRLAIEFAGEAGLTYFHVRDRHKQLAGLGIPGLPMTIFVRADGTIAGSHPGELESAAQVSSLMDQYLGAR